MTFYFWSFARWCNTYRVTFQTWNKIVRKWNFPQLFLSIDFTSAKIRSMYCQHMISILKKFFFSRSWCEHITQVFFFLCVYVSALMYTLTNNILFKVYFNSMTMQAFHVTINLISSCVIRNCKMYWFLTMCRSSPFSQKVSTLFNWNYIVFLMETFLCES